MTGILKIDYNFSFHELMWKNFYECWCFMDNINCAQRKNIKKWLSKEISEETPLYKDLADLISDYTIKQCWDIGEGINLNSTTRKQKWLYEEFHPESQKHFYK